MATLLYRLGKWCSIRHWVVIGIWLVTLALVSVGAVALRGPATTSLSIPDTPFSRVLGELQSKIPSAAGGSGIIVVHTESGTPFTAEQRTALAEVVARWATVPSVAEVRDPFVVQAKLANAQQELAVAERGIAENRAKLAQGEQQLAAADAQLTAAEQQLAAMRAQLDAAPVKDPAAVAQLEQVAGQLSTQRIALTLGKSDLERGKADLEEGVKKIAAGQRQAALTKDLRFVSDRGDVALVTLRFHTEAQSIPQPDRDALVSIGSTLADRGMGADYSNELIMNVNSVLSATESIGVVLAGVVLVVTLGSLIAAGLPVMMALVGVGVGLGGTFVITHWVEMHQITPMLGLMLGLAVGIDYSLFIVNRHRIQLVHDIPMHESIGRATGTSGNAVSFAGLTVLIALAALGLTGIPFLGVMGYVGAATVACAVLVAVTLTPAMLGLIGPRILTPKAWAAAGYDPTGRRTDTGPDDDHTPHGKVRWGRFVTGRPVLSLLFGLVVLAVLAIPSASLKLGLPDGGSEPADSTAYRAYTLIGDSFGKGANGAMLAVAHLPQRATEGDALAAELDVAERLARVDGIVAVAPIGMSADRSVAAFRMVPAYGPADERTVEIVHGLRNDADKILADTGSRVELTGLTVANIDISAKLGDALPRYLAVVVGLALIILLLVFRSVFVPLIAAVGFLLSLAASFGAVVAVYQWGWLSSVFGVTQPTPVLSFLPTILIGVLFGLAMDYQMFLVSGMREAHQHGEEAREAVFHGYRNGARVVTAAAVIMVCVFAGFIFAHLTMVRPIGFGLAIGVALDAFLVRMTIVPAVMRLVGERAWWLPRWLDRVLPEVDVEGVRLVEHLEAEAAAGAAARAG